MSGQLAPAPPRSGGGPQPRSQPQSQYSYAPRQQQQPTGPPVGAKPTRGGHQRNLSSVGDATSLFGQSTAHQSTGPAQDFMSSLGQQQPSQQPQTPGGGIGTVFEEDEPESSPELGRRHYNQYDNDHYNTGAYGSNHDQYQQQSSYWGQQPPQQEQHHYDSGVSSAAAGTGSTAYDDYSNQDWDAAANSYANDDNDATPADYFEPPFYPGFRYDPVTNTYVEDPSTAGATVGADLTGDQSSWDHSASNQTAMDGDVANGQAQDDYQYSAQQQQQQQQSSYDYQSQDFGDDGDQQYDQEPQDPQSYMGTWDHNAPPVSQDAAAETGLFDQQQQQSAMNNESWDYNEDQDPYADQPDPYATAAASTTGSAPQESSPQPSTQPEQQQQQPSQDDFYSEQSQQYDLQSSNEPAASTHDPYAPGSEYGQQQQDQSQSQSQSQSQDDAYDWSSQSQENQYDLQDSSAGQAGYDQQSYGYDQQQTQDYDATAQGHDAYGQQQYGEQASWDQYQQGTGYEEPVQQSQDSYDPYAPPTQQSQQQAYTYQPQQPTPYAPPSVVSNAPPASAYAPPPSSIASPLASSVRSALSPPPRTSSRGSTTSNAPPPRRTGAAPPPPKASSAVAPPPPKTTNSTNPGVPPPPRASAPTQSRVGGPMSPTSPLSPTGSNASSTSTSYFQRQQGQKQSPVTAGRTAGAASTPPAPAPPKSSSAPNAVSDNRQQHPPSASSNATTGGTGKSLYSPPPPTRTLHPAPPRSAAGQPASTSYRGPPPVQPRRLPHQRGASAFAGDSPYATIPDVPPVPSASSIAEEQEQESELEQGSEQEQEQQGQGQDYYEQNQQQQQQSSVPPPPPPSRANPAQQQQQPKQPAFVPPPPKQQASAPPRQHQQQAGARDGMMAPPPSRRPKYAAPPQLQTSGGSSQPPQQQQQPELPRPPPVSQQRQQQGYEPSPLSPRLDDRPPRLGSKTPEPSPMQKKQQLQQQTRAGPLPGSQRSQQTAPPPAVPVSAPPPQKTQSVPPPPPASQSQQRGGQAPPPPRAQQQAAPQAPPQQQQNRPGPPPRAQQPPVQPPAPPRARSPAPPQPPRQKTPRPQVYQPQQQQPDDRYAPKPSQQPQSAPPQRAQQQQQGSQAPFSQSSTRDGRAQVSRPPPPPQQQQPPAQARSYEPAPVANIDEQQPDPYAPTSYQPRDQRESGRGEEQAVPGISLEAPSPDLAPQRGYDEQQPVDEQAHVSSEPAYDYDGQDAYDEDRAQGPVQSDYYEEQLDGHDGRSGASTPSGLTAGSRSGLSASGGQQQEEYGFDDSAVFDGGMSASTSGSTYGEWTGQSEANDGYDYVTTGTLTGLATDEKSEGFDDADTHYDPYAPQHHQTSSAYDPVSNGGEANAGQYYDEQYDDGAQGAADDSYEQKHEIPSRESTYTPPGRSQSQFSSPAKPTPAELAAAIADQSSYDAYAPSQQTTSRDQQPQPVQQQEPSTPYDPYAPQSQLTDEPHQQQQQAAGGDYYDDSQYAPYDPNAPARRYSDDDEDDQPYNPYVSQQGLSRQMSASSLAASAGAVPCDLGWERNTAPIVSFGFGGRMLLVYPSTTSSTNLGRYDSSRPYGTASSTSQASSGSTVHIRKLDDILAPPDALTFPGPLYLDGGKASIGKKRKDAVAWLDRRADELEKEAQYARSVAPPQTTLSATQDSQSEAVTRRRKIETRLVLVKLIKVLVENEGKLGGTPKIDEAVRSILVPHSSHQDITDADLPTASQLAFPASGAKTASTGNEKPFATYPVTTGNLDKIAAFLVRGERRKAVKYTLDHKLWAHAFVISSCVDTDCWKDVVMEFLRSELTPKPDSSDGGANGREAMRVAYSMFAGLGAESIEQFVPPVSLAPSLVPMPSLPSGMPVARSNSPLPGTQDKPVNRNLSQSVLEKWQETVAMIIANRTVGDSAALTALGDALLANGWLDAAHVCFLLSPATSLIGGTGTPSARICLVGSTAPSLEAREGVDSESIKLTELVEFAFSLTPAPKGQEQFLGFPHLQPFRLYHATQLADSGHVAQALKYAEAIAATIKQTTKPSPYYTPALVAQCKALSDRLTAAPGQGKGGSWITRMVPRGPTKETLWSTLEGGFTKFVSGEGDPSPQALAAKAEVAKKANGAAIGPFSHYSSIAPGSTTGTLSRAQSTLELMSPVNPPSRPASAAAAPMSSPVASLAPPVPSLPPPPQQQQHGQQTQSQSQGPPPVKRAPFKTHHSRSSSLGVAGYNYDPTAPPPWQAHINARQQQQQQDSDSTPRMNAHDGYGWGSDAQGGSRTSTFTSVPGQGFSEDSSGFISPMGQYTPTVSPGPSSVHNAYNAQQQLHKRTTTQDELEDLGIGNNKSRKPGFDAIDEGAGEGEDGATTPTDPYAPPKSSAAKAEPSKPELKTSASKSWLGGWFKREASPVPNGPGPVKAKLGDPSSMVFDAELKKWVVKGGSKETSAPLATAPPPRAATASPSRALRFNPPPRFQSETPPPLPRSTGATPAPPLSRSATTSDLRSAGQFRSASTPATGMPPPLRPPSAQSGASTPAGGAAAARRKAKPRYVPVT